MDKMSNMSSYFVDVNEKLCSKYKISGIEFFNIFELLIYPSVTLH